MTRINSKSISAVDLITAADNEKAVRSQLVLEAACKEAGVVFDGIQKPLFPETTPLLLFSCGKNSFHIPIPNIMGLPLPNIVQVIQAKIQEEKTVETKATASTVSYQDPSTGRPIEPGQVKYQPDWTPCGPRANSGSFDELAGLKKKLHSVYSEISAIVKNGENANQHYRYVKAADVVETVRAALIKVGVYAEINFEFANQYTIDRGTGKAPFAATNVACRVLLHDLDSSAVLTCSGLGTGADGGDKAVYKAQTGALKYALLSGFLIPGTDEDPEGDTTTDEPPTSFEDARVRREPTQQATPKASHQTPLQPPVPAMSTAVAPSAAAGSLAASAVLYAPEDTRLPNADELNAYRVRFKNLGDDLAAKGGLKASKDLPLNRKLLVYLLRTENVNDAAELTVGQWNSFFAGVAHIASSGPNGLAVVADLVNASNGVTTKTK